MDQIARDYEWHTVILDVRGFEREVEELLMPVEREIMPPRDPKKAPRG